MASIEENRQKYRVIIKTIAKGVSEDPSKRISWYKETSSS